MTQAPPASAQPPAAQSAPPVRKTIRGLGDMKSLYVRPMPQNFDQTLRVEIKSELGDRIKLVSSPNGADAVMEIVMEDEARGPAVVGSAGRILGLSGKKKVSVTIIEPQQRRTLWSAEAGDRKTYFGSFGDGGKRTASRIAKKLKHDASN